MEGADELPGIMWPIGVEVKTLSPSMDACVGASATMCFQGGVEDAGQCILKNILYGSTMNLALPAIKVGAVMAQMHFHRMG